MFEESGLKIAMGNAEEMLKQRADYVTSSNRHDGAAEAIENISYESWFYSWIRVQAAVFYRETMKKSL